MEFPTFINWTNLFPFKGFLGGILHFYSHFNRIKCKQTVETLIRCYRITNLGLHCLHMYHKKDSRSIYGLMEEHNSMCMILFVLLLLCPKSTVMVMEGRSLHLTTLFPGQA